MPIKMDLNGSSQIKTRVSSSGTVLVKSDTASNTKRLEILLEEEIANRILGDKTLQQEIDSLTEKSAAYILITEQENGSIDISLLNEEEEVLDTKTISLTEKVIKEMVVDYDNSKIIYTCNDNSTIELDISSIVDRITEAFADLALVHQELDEHTAELEAHTEELAEHTEELASHSQELSIINQEISDINDDISILKTDVAAHTVELSILDARTTALEGDVANLNRTKVDKVLSIYPHLDPSSLTIEQIDNLLLYVSQNGVPNYAKLNELGFARIKDIEDIDKVDVGDLLIDMN